MLITNGKRTLDVSEKAYEVVYKGHGFVPFHGDAVDPINNKQSELMELKKDELLEMAQGMQLEVNDKMTKAEIVAAIEAADAE